MPLPTLGPIPFVAWITVAAVLTASAIILPVVLTLPETYSCSQQDAGNYYVKLIDPPQVNVSRPPIVCPYYSSKRYNYHLVCCRIINCSKFQIRPSNSTEQTFLFGTVRIRPLRWMGAI